MMVYDIDGCGIPAYGIGEDKAKFGKKRIVKTRGQNCVYNKNVSCTKYTCANCGFNPNKKRVEK